MYNIRLQQVSDIAGFRSEIDADDDETVHITICRKDHHLLPAIIVLECDCTGSRDYRQRKYAGKQVEAEGAASPGAAILGHEGKEEGGFELHRSAREALDGRPAL